ncbi:MAG: MFS transporter [Desulfobulbus propionicus]|nr:MAG: MFS transporter [Desulfobulbus propionicus]
MAASHSSPFALTNVRLFLAFRIFFNARFYYPVFTVLFLDYGLSIEEFALLNTVWAFTIVLAEVPSGALADLIGRKRLLLTTAFCMLWEMLLLAFVPLGNHSLVFSVFLLNRVLSGLAEAMASGADEAMAYDTLVREGLEDTWPQVLEMEMRLRSLVHVVAMTLGALLYDPSMVNRLLDLLGSSRVVTQEITMRFPVFLTLGLAVLALVTVLRMQDLRPDEEASELNTASTREVFSLTLNAGRWIWQTPFALAVIGFAMVFDHVLRMLVTLASQYYRVIGLPEASFGIIGSAIALLGVFVPRLARWMVERYSPARNLLWLCVLSILTLLGLTLFIPYFGVLPMMLVFSIMMMTSFFTSHYLNQLADSRQRATILSFKGLAFNAAYGSIGILYALLVAKLRAAQHTGVSADLIEDLAFRQSITWFPGYLVVGLLLTALLTLPRFRHSAK